MTDASLRAPEPNPDGAPPRRLIGVGVGPGDPELITVKAVRALSEADLVLVPHTETGSDAAGRAEAVAVGACPGVAGRVRRVRVEMTGPVSAAQRAAARETTAEAALEAFATGATTIAFATIGDPSVYSTFGYLADAIRARLPEVDIQLVPGIMALQAVAAAAGAPLVEGDEVLTLVPATAGKHAVDDALEAGGCVVVYKAGRRLAQLLQSLQDHDRMATAVVGTDVSTSHQNVRPAAEAGDGGGYFTTIVALPRRTTKPEAS